MKIFFREKVSTGFENFFSLGMDISKTPIPVVSDPQYLCSGLKRDNYGRTTNNNLFCLGKSECTGLHDRNRLVSTPLLETVFCPCS